MRINWDLEHVYFYLVSFVSLILIIIGAVTITQTAIAYVTPINEEYNPYTVMDPNPDLIQWEEKFGPEFVEQERERFETISNENISRRLLRDLVRGIAFIAVALPVYLYHWRKIPKLDLPE
ncbi:MAG: hypothetical protein FJ152_08065 [Firmicutes bacterium]|nr:hypothetical protein [Bacillota bacterium]